MYSDEINEAVSRMTFAEKREALSDWDWWFRKQLNMGRRASDFRDWLAERTEQRLQREADKRNADMDFASAYRGGYRIASPEQLKGWNA